MKLKLSCIFLALCLLVPVSLLSQDINDVKWSQDPSTKVRVLGEYPNLPNTVTFENPNKETRVVTTPAGTFYLAANIRPFPHTATQSEIDVTSMRANPNIVWAAWNSYGPSFYGTGFCATTNNGVNWTGNYQTFSPNSGDPACWVWPTGSTWAGRFGHSVIQGAGHSTNNGTTWVFDMNFPGASSFDKNLSCVDDVPGSPFLGRAYTVWTNFGGTYVNRIVGSYSTDGGVTWSTAAPVSPVPASGHHQQGCDVRVGPGGVVYVVWGHCTTNGQNSTEDNLGFAKSTDGGVTWAVSNNNVVDINGIRAQNLFNGIRANGFPRLDIDKNGGPRNGWIYVVIGEKTIAPATDVADICMARSTDGGTTWTHTRVNQDPPASGRYQYFGSVVVDPMGGVNVFYYDQRNTTGYVTQTYLSRSVDGGNTWSDVQVSDHNFTPAPISGLAYGYQGDYISIAYGTNKLWPFWADNSSGIYQAWTAGIDLGPGIAHTPLSNTENLAGPYVVNCVITPAGSNIDPTKTRLLWSRNNPNITDSLLMTNTSGNNWTANIPGNGTPSTYRYYIKTADLLGRYATAPSGAPAVLYSFEARPDTVKPVITHTPLVDMPKTSWPATVLAGVTDNIGIDSVWVRWYRNTPSTGLKVFRLPNIGGSNYQAAFNSDTSQVQFNDSIFYRVIAQDNSSGHNKDSTALYHFKLVAIANACIGTGTTAVGYPYYTFYMDSRTLMLYTASEIISGGGAPGNITKIGFNVSGTPASQTMNGFQIKMQNTTQTSLTGFINTGWTTVYTGTYTVPGTGWQYVNLQTPYNWNGTQNLLVEICFDNTSYTSNTNVNSTAATGMTWHYHTDNSTGCSLSGGSLQSTRPNICMTINLLVGNETKQFTVPAVFNLEQNYPNPFNPSTSIKFNIPKTSHVKLIVYDVVGKQVATLVNEMKQPGSYEAVFDGENLASGVYFYRIEAGPYTDVKKMVLIK